MSARTDKASKTAFYDMGRGTGGFRDWLTLLHPPYTVWHLSYVAIGAALVPHPVLWRLGGTLLAFFLAVGHRRARVRRAERPAAGHRHQR